jgi:hypothetical protein
VIGSDALRTEKRGPQDISGLQRNIDVAIDLI